MKYISHVKDWAYVNEVNNWVQSVYEQYKIEIISKPEKKSAENSQLLSYLQGSRQTIYYCRGLISLHLSYF